MAILRGPDQYALAEKQLASLPHDSRRDDAICRILHGAIPTYSWVGIYRPIDGELVRAAWSGEGRPRTPRSLGIDSREPREVNDLRSSSQSGRFLATARAETQCPFATAGGAGMLAIASKYQGAFGPTDRDLIQLVVAMLEDRGR